jgi:hypothetical protein
VQAGRPPGASRRPAAQPGDRQARTARLNGRATLRLTDEGSDSPVTSVLDDPVLNRKLWPALPELGWVARDVAAKTGATVLLETNEDSPAPVVACARYGAGRVFYIGTDESWRWRDRLGERVHQTFWLQAVRWGLGLRLRGSDPRLQVSVDRTLMTPDDSAEVRARATLADGTPVADPVRMRLERLDSVGEPVGSPREFELSPVRGSASLRSRSVGGLTEGDWRITVTVDRPDFSGLAEVRELTVRKSQGREGLELGADLASLRRIAGASRPRAGITHSTGRASGGGRAGSFADCEIVARELARGLSPRRTYTVTSHSLWDNYWALVAVVVLLLGEWVWRKRFGLP